MRNSVVNPFLQFNLPNVDKAAGLCKLYLGVKNATNPEANQVQAYAVLPDGSELPIAQPITLSAGGVAMFNGSPVEIRVAVDEYSLKLTTSAGAQLYYDPSVGASVSASNLADVDSDVLIAGVPAKTLVTSATRRAINAQAFGLKPNDTSFNNWTKAKELFDYCRTNKYDMYFPSGRWTVIDLNWPFLNDEFPITSLLDCYNITLFGDGPSTILETRSTAGADVLNLRALKNFHVSNLSVEATISGGVAGSNGVSLVYGWDNVTVTNVWAKNLPYVEKPSFLDGGKAFTIQPGTLNLQICGSLKASVFAKGCVHAVGYEIDLPSFINQRPAIDVEFFAEDCYESVVISAGAPSSAVPESLTTGFNCRGFSINSQKDLISGRAHGANIDIHVITTKSLAARKLNPSGVQWKTGDNEVSAAIILAAKNCNFWLKGDKRECTTKITVGGANAGAAGYSADSKNCTIDIDVAGAGTVSDFTVEVFSGQSVSTCELVISKKTIAVPPVELYKGANQNAIWSGTDLQLQLLQTRNLSFVGNTDPNVTYATLSLTNDMLTSRLLSASAPSAPIHDFVNFSGTRALAIRNDGAISTSATSAATSVSTVSAAMPIYNEGGVLVGYIPIYSTFA